MAAAAEVTMICLDNSSCLLDHPFSEAQYQGVKLYCEIKFKCNPQNLVGLFRMSSSRVGTKVAPTNDFSYLLWSLREIFDWDCGGQADFSTALHDTYGDLVRDFPYMKKRILVFVGSPIKLDWTSTEPLGKALKDFDVALDVVNLFILEDDIYLLPTMIMTKLTAFVNVDNDNNNREKEDSEYDARWKLLRLFYGEYHYGREQLGELVTFADDNGNSHLVEASDASSVLRVIYMSILRKNVRYLKKKNKKKPKKNLVNANKSRIW